MSSLVSAGRIRLGDLNIGRIGLGSNRLTDTPDNAAFLTRALELGLDFIDTADIYTNGESESTLGKYLGSEHEGLVIATKGGVVHGLPPDGSPAYLRQALEASLRRLRREHIDLYQLHLPDPRVRFEDSVGCLLELRQQGKIRHVGLSNVSVAQIEIACSLGQIVSVQNEYNLSERQHQDVLDYCQRQGIVFLPYFPLRLGNYHDRVAIIARKHAATPAQVALAWLLQQAEVMVPIPGTRSAAHLAVNLAAVSLRLDAEDLALLRAEVSD